MVWGTVAPLEGAPGFGGDIALTDLNDTTSEIFAARFSFQWRRTGAPLVACNFLGKCIQEHK